MIIGANVIVLEAGFCTGRAATIAVLRLTLFS